MAIETEVLGAARVLRIARPAERNALDAATLRGLARAAKAAAAAPDARVLVVTGAGETFCAGGDLRTLGALPGRAGGRTVARLGREALDALRRVGLPVVAAVNGDAFGGGCELAAACDYRIVDARARLHWVQGRMGVTTGWGGTERLVALVGPGRAAGWLLAARAVGADEALAAGFADEVAAPGTTLAAAAAFAEAVARVSVEVTRRQLALLRRAAAASGAGLRAAEHAAFAATWALPEHAAAVERFFARARR